MGIWGYISSTSDSLKRNTPDLTAVKDWCWSPFGYGLAAVTKMDEETWSWIVQAAANVAKNAAVYGCHEGLKSLPGGTLIYQVVVQSIPGEKKFEVLEGEMKALQARVAELEEIIKKGEMKGLQAIVANPEEIIKKYEGLERVEKHQPCADLKSNVREKPEDVIRVFMMKEFIGRQFLDDLTVLEVRRMAGRTYPTRRQYRA